MARPAVDSEWIPNVRVGVAAFGAHIKPLVDDGYVALVSVVDDVTGWDSYRVVDVVGLADTQIYAEGGVIVSIRCCTHCLRAEFNLVGAKFPDVVARLEQSMPGTWDTIWLEGDGEPHEEQVFDFDELGAQLWVRDGIVTTVFCADYSA